jgi:hypothetical protein
VSANDDINDEFGVAEDLEDLLAAPAKSAAKKTSAVPRAARESGTAAVPSGAVVLTSEQLEQLKNSLRAEITADLKKAEPTPTPTVVVNTGRDNRPLEIRPTLPPEEGTAEDGIKVHFVEDGFTLGARVFYRGEEFIAPSDSLWARLTPAQQMARYGKQLFRQGPWEGADFDLNDPALTEDDRAKLLEIMQARKAAEPVRT